MSVCRGACVRKETRRISVCAEERRAEEKEGAAEYAGISTVKPVWSSIPALCCCTLNVRRKLNSRGGLKIEPVLSDPSSAPSTDAQKEIKPLLLLLASPIFFLYTI